MKSILNDVNRLEKAYELFLRLITACNDLVEQRSTGAQKIFYSELKTAKAFIEKSRSGNDQ